jgi:glycosyltransferase involved in cell wall biosynthesis
MEVANKPYISVIITAYNRKEFLLDAFNSVLNQTLDRSKYEIIVTKNFVDEKIDSYIKKNGGKLVFFEKGSVGAQIADALKYAKGEVICFLEDDDLFVKEKLKYVYDTFQKNKSIVYINNARKYIDENKRYLSKSPLIFEKRREKDIIIREADKKPINLLKIQQYSGSFLNSSSIAIKTSVLKRFVDDLKNTKATDLFYYFISLLSGDLLISAKELTLYRVHESMSSSINDYFSFKAVNCKYFEDEKYIANMILKRNSIKINKGLKKYAYIRLKEREIYYLFYAGNYRKRVLLNYLKIFPYIVRAFPEVTILRGLQVAFYIIAPEKFRRFNYEITKKYMYSIMLKKNHT